MRVVPAVVALVALAAGACAGPGAPPPAAPASPAATTAAPCGVAGAAPARYQHVLWIFLENKEEDEVVGSAQAPYLNRLAGECGVAVNDHGVAHPSLPNYLAAVSGSTGGVSSDCAPADCPQARPTIFSQLDAAGRGWATYAESMPAPCFDESAGEYAAKHNPAVYFPALRPSCRRDDRPLSALPPALRAGALPPFVLIVPNICDDMHDCSIATGDAWLARWVPRLLASPAYRSGGTALFLTFDEGSGGNRIATVVLSPSTPPGTRSAQGFTHYSLLRTTEQLLRLPPLGAAASAPSMRAAFHL